MFSATQHRRERLINYVHEYVHLIEVDDQSKLTKHQKDLTSLLKDWLEIHLEKSDRPTLVYDKMVPHFEALLETDKDPLSLLNKIWSERDMFPKVSQWIVSVCAVRSSTHAGEFV